MRALDELTGLVSSKFEVIKDLITMIKLETRLAGLSVFPLLVSLCVLFVVTITVWLSAMILLGYGISIAYNSILLAITAILIFNLICLLLLAKYLLYNLKKMSFEKTRKYFNQKERKDEPKKASDQSSGQNGKKITT
jgi:predicted membrane protein